MLDTLADFFKSPEGKTMVLIGGAIIGTLTAVQYYHNIKYTRLQIKQLQAEMAAMGANNNDLA